MSFLHKCACLQSIRIPMTEKTDQGAVPPCYGNFDKHCTASDIPPMVMYTFVAQNPHPSFPANT